MALVLDPSVTDSRNRVETPSAPKAPLKKVVKEPKGEISGAISVGPTAWLSPHTAAYGLIGGGDAVFTPKESPRKSPRWTFSLGVYVNVILGGPQNAERRENQHFYSSKTKEIYGDQIEKWDNELPSYARRYDQTRMYAGPSMKLATEFLVLKGANKIHLGLGAFLGFMIVNGQRREWLKFRHQDRFQDEIYRPFIRPNLEALGTVRINLSAKKQVDLLLGLGVACMVNAPGSVPEMFLNECFAKFNLGVRWGIGKARDY